MGEISKGEGNLDRLNRLCYTRDTIRQEKVRMFHDVVSVSWVYQEIGQECLREYLENHSER